MNQIWQTIEQFHMLEENDRVLLGVSGGPDSMALLHLLNSRKEQYHMQLFVAHIHHKLRPQADAEARYVEQICKEWGIPFRLFVSDVADYAKTKRMSLEQAGHVVRHNCFREAAEEWKITKLALGHHADDRAESMILHLLQGCGLDGLTAMPPKDGWIIRPLAQVKKQDLIRYCEQNGLKYFIDSTNLEPNCLRNRIRLQIIPELRNENPEITDTLLRLQDSCVADVDYLEQCTEALWKQYGSFSGGIARFPAEMLRNQHISLQRRLLRYLYRMVTGSETNLTFRQTEQMREISMRKNGSQQISLAGEVYFVRQYDTLCVKKGRQQTKEFCYMWEFPSSLEVYEADCVFTAEVLEWPDSILEPKTVYMDVDADKLQFPLQVRSRIPGDRLTMLYGHKKLKDFFIDKKIPAEKRDCIPVVVSGKEIIWIPGYYAAESVRITDETRKIYRLSCNSSMFL